MSDTQTTALTTRTTSTGHTLTIDLDRMHLTIDGPTETMDAIPDAEIHSLCADAGVQWLGEVVDETTYAVRPNPIAVTGLVWGTPPRFDRDVWERDGFPAIRGTVYLTFRGTQALCSVSALYRGPEFDYLFVPGLDDEIRADIEWALAPFYELTPSEVDAMVAAVIAAVKAETVTE